jgi:hypothetical protein
MLNSTFEYLWVVTPDGTVYVDNQTEIRTFSSFEALAKHADSFELEEIVAMKMEFDRKAEQRKLEALEAKRRRTLVEDAGAWQQPRVRPVDAHAVAASTQKIISTHSGNDIRVNSVNLSTRSEKGTLRTRL